MYTIYKNQIVKKYGLLRHIIFLIVFGLIPIYTYRLLEPLLVQEEVLNENGY